VLSNDVLAYVAYARLLFRHGLNPYVADRLELELAGDPAAGFLIWGTPLAYGPLWTIGAAALGAVGSFAGLLGEIAIHKAAAAVALLWCAVVGGRLAEALAPGRGTLTVFAIGLNPLLLLEGPGSGHNDLAMMALILGGALMTARARHTFAALLVGLACAVKAPALAVVPLLIIGRMASSGGRDWRGAATTLGLTLAPLFVLSVVFGGPAVFANVFGIQLTEGEVAGRIQGAKLLIVPATAWGTWLTWRHTRPDSANWVLGFVPIALVLALFVSAVPFPWYLTWALLPALTGWSEAHRIAIVTTGTLGFILTWLYVVTP
jgi:hypothetical protein